MRNLSDYSMTPTETELARKLSRLLECRMSAILIDAPASDGLPKYGVVARSGSDIIGAGNTLFGAISDAIETVEGWDR